MPVGHANYVAFVSSVDVPNVNEALVDNSEAVFKSCEADRFVLVVDVYVVII